MQECFHRYSISKQIANKPSGSVYLAHPVNDVSQQVVLEVFNAAYIAPEQQSGNFLQKVEKIKQLRHSSIVPILDLGVEQGQLYVVRKYLTSDSLRSRLDYLSPQRLSLQEALTIIMQVGQVLCYAHQQNILHGNIKPETIFFNGDGKVLVSDFGLASFIDMAKLSQKADLQAISYLAPEGFVSSITAESDQYALACLAYELITGRLPFSSQSMLSVVPVPLIAANGASGKASERRATGDMDLAVLVQAGSFCENSQCPDYGKVGNDNVRKYGKTNKGKQRWQCRTCQATWSFSSTWAKDHLELLIPPSDLVPNLPEPIEEAMLKAMAQDPSQRYADVSLFLRVLQRVPLAPSVFGVPPITPSFNTRVTLEPLENMESEVPLAMRLNEAPLATYLPEHSERVHNQYSDSKALVTSARDTYGGTFPQARRSSSGNGKSVRPTLWLAFALSGIVLLVGTLILYALVPSRLPGSVNPVKRGLTTPIVPNATHAVPSVVPTPQSSPQVHVTPPMQSALPSVGTTLNGLFAEQNGDVYNLTTQGQIDWVHWGLNVPTEVDRKSGVQPQISTYSLIGNGTVQRDSTNSGAYNWSDGMPTTSLGGSQPSGIYVQGLNNGFTITIPASTTVKTLKVYVGVYHAKGKLTASLNGKIYQDATLEMNDVTRGSLVDNCIYTLVFGSAPNQTLTVSYTLMTSGGSDAYVSLQSAALQ